MHNVPPRSRQIPVYILSKYRGRASSVLLRANRKQNLDAGDPFCFVNPALYQTLFALGLIVLDFLGVTCLTLLSSPWVAFLNFLPDLDCIWHFCLAWLSLVGWLLKVGYLAVILDSIVGKPRENCKIYRGRKVNFIELWCFNVFDEVSRVHSLTWAASFVFLYGMTAVLLFVFLLISTAWF